MSLRITGGRFKGKKLKTLKMGFIRPTSSKVREAFFNICRDKIENSFFLDLFSGSGIMGIEALSRGASFCCFIDKKREAIDLIKRNIEMLGIEECTRVICGDVFFVLKKLKTSFDIVYMDPPYRFYEDKTFLKRVFDSLEKNEILKRGSHLFVEGPELKGYKDFPYHRMTKKYGEISLSQYVFE
jgi:16S rRNA (guanine(966)-N(2))-methyltransferase RsmD